MDLTLSELEEAWERVRANDGCAGVDGVTVGKFSATLRTSLPALLRAIGERRYRPLPLLRILVRKHPDSKEPRQLLVPTVRDRVAQTAVARRLMSSFEDEFLDASYAYRPGRGVDRAVARIIQLRNRGYTTVVRADVSSYFDLVPHAGVETSLAEEKLPEWQRDLIHLWLRCEVWDGHLLRPLRKGLPQGSPLSPVLANLFLHEFDVALTKLDCHLIRYADDLLLLCDGLEQARASLELAREWMAAHQLSLNSGKTHITDFKMGFTFLGVYFLESQAYRPWREDPVRGSILAMAKPMSPILLARCSEVRTADPPFRMALRRALETSDFTPDVPAGSNAISNRRIPNVAFLYLTEQGSVLRKSGDRVLVEKEGHILLDLPYHKLESVLVFGNVQITTQALTELMDAGISVSFLSRAGRYRGSVRMPEGKDIPLRMEQFRRFCDPAAALELAKAQVVAKLLNSADVLKTRSTGAPPVGAGQLEHLAGEAQKAPAIDALLGVEGAASRSYFGGLMKFNRSEFEWRGRERHPSPDPLNALLSMAYTLVAAELRSLVESHGLDSGIGCLHQPDYGRPSLAFDLMEPFRAPVADRFVLTQVNRGVFKAADFQPHSDSGGVWMTPEALTRFLERWERWMLVLPESEKAPDASLPSLRREMRREVERFVACLHDKSAWTAWRWDRLETEEEKHCDSLSATT